MVDTARINNTLGKMALYLSNHNSICVGVSGGSDSNIIVHIIATYFRQYLPKVHFCFQNTGLEYRATLRHLDYMEKRYNIHIDRIKPEKGDGVVSVVRREGLPIVSKEFSTMVEAAERGVDWALRKLERERSEDKYAVPQKQKALAHYLIEQQIPVSFKCCNLSKKKPHKLYAKKMKADLDITGERRSEGGQRALTHKSCFETGKGIDKYMPLFFWDDDTKQYYKETEGIVYSDCYEVWGMTRTGCVGCPFNSRVGEDLKKIKQYEPGLYKACMNVFGQSYKLMDDFNIHKIKIFSDQLSFDDLGELK